MSDHQNQDDIDALLAGFDAPQDEPPQDGGEDEADVDIDALISEVSESGASGSDEGSDQDEPAGEDSLPPDTSEGSEDAATDTPEPDHGEPDHGEDDDDDSTAPNDEQDASASDEDAMLREILGDQDADSPAEPHEASGDEASDQEQSVSSEEVAGAAEESSDSAAERTGSISGVRLPEADHRIIDRLDEITSETEAKTNEVMDRLDSAIEKINGLVDESDSLFEQLKEHEQVIDMLSKKHPDNPVVRLLLDISETFAKAHQLRDRAYEAQDEVFVAMDLLQFQDISRQKIEKVISVIRALNDYLNTWFGSSDPAKARAGVARTMGRDDARATESDDVEALIEQFNEKG